MCRLELLQQTAIVSCIWGVKGEIIVKHSSEMILVQTAEMWRQDSTQYKILKITKRKSRKFSKRNKTSKCGCENNCSKHSKLMEIVLWIDFDQIKQRLTGFLIINDFLYNLCQHFLATLFSCCKLNPGFVNFF